MEKECIGLFSFDGPMFKDKNGIYCNTTLTSEMFKRYYSVVDKLIIVIRTFKIDITYIEANLNKVELDNVEFIEIENLNNIKNFILKKSIYQKIIFEKVKEADLIFARIPSIISDMTISCCKKLKKKYLAEVGGCVWDAYFNHSLIGKIVAPYMYYKEKIGVRDSCYTIYVTEKWLQKRYPTKGYSINASNVYLKKIDEKVIENRKVKIKKFSRENEIIIGTTAAVDVKYKGQEYVIKAIKLLEKEGYKFRYELVGGGNPKYLKEIAKKNKIEEKIIFKGVMLKNEVMRWLETIDIYIQPSKQEGLPRALIEALSMGVPALGSKTAGIPELLKDEFVFKRGNVCEIKEKIESIFIKNLEDIVQENINKSKEFEVSYLNQKREKIYKMYKNLILEEKEYIR